MKRSQLPDWQLPKGVNRGLWEYVQDEQLARRYDADLQDAALLQIDRQFVEKYCTKPGRLVDLGCGTGRLLVPLAAKGHWALGIDLSAEMLKVAGEKAQAAQLHIERLQANLVELDCLADGSFDYALCMFSTLGMVNGRAHRQRVLEHVYRLLKPGGRFLLHVHNRWFNFWNPTGRRWLFIDCWRSLLGAADRGDRLMPAHDGQSSLILHVFTRREITGLLQQAGFRLVEIHPVSLREDGELPRPWCFGWLRAYGYLIAAEKAEK